MLHLLTGSGFIVLTLVFYYSFIKTIAAALPAANLFDATRKTYIRKLTIVLLGWGIVAAVVSLTGFAGKFELFPLNIAPFLLLPLITIILFTLSKTTRELLYHIPEHHLIRLQVFRVFVEVLLWLLFIQNLIPQQMSFEGRNFDIVAGLTAPLVAYLSITKKTSRGFLIFWNLACLGLLINIVTVAIMSMPTPFRYFMNEPSNTIVTQFPYVLLPTFLVPLAYMLHFLSLRQLFLKSKM